MKNVLFCILFLCFSTNAFAALKSAPFQGSILVTNEKAVGDICDFWIKLGGTFIEFSNVEKSKSHYLKKGEENTFRFNYYSTIKKTGNNGITKETYILDDIYNENELLILYDSGLWSDVDVFESIFTENSKFNELERKIISLLYKMSTNANKDLLSETDFYILESLYKLGHEQSKSAYEKYKKILKNHQLKQTATFVSIACTILILLFAVGYFLYKYREKVLVKMTKTRTQRLGIIFFFLVLIFIFLEKKDYFYLDNEAYLFFILVPLVISFFMVLGIIDSIYRWIIGGQGKS